MAPKVCSNLRWIKTGIITLPHRAHRGREGFSRKNVRIGKAYISLAQGRKSRKSRIIESGIHLIRRALISCIRCITQE